MTLQTLQAPLPWQEDQWQRLAAARSGGQLAHAYLLAGEQGLGKALFARDFARAVLCDSSQTLDGTPASPDGTPQQHAVACGTCASCLTGGEESLHPDIRSLAVEEDAKSISVDQVRDLSDFLQRTSHSGKWKLALVQEAHRMNPAAANALLKTLEEPTAATTLLLVSDLPGRLLPTVRSRCQKLPFKSPSAAAGLQWLESRLPGEPCSELLALARGRPMQALQLAANEGLDTWRKFSGRLEQLWQGRAGLAAVCAELDKMDIETVLGYLQSVASTLVKTVLFGGGASSDDGKGNASSDNNGTRPPHLAAQLQSLEKALAPAVAAPDGRLHTARRLLHFGGRVDEAIRQTRSTANPNTRLIIESLLNHWQSLPKPKEVCGGGL